MVVKRSTIGFFIMLFAIFAFIFIGCNEPGGDNDREDAIEVVLTDGGFYTLGSADNYPGAVINFANLDGASDLVDISKYSSVTVEAVLYTGPDEENDMLTQEEVNAIEVNEDKALNLAQFTVLNVGSLSDWDDKTKFAAVTKYHMGKDGETIQIINAQSLAGVGGGIPKGLLIQANKADYGEIVTHIKVISITFEPVKPDVIPLVVMDYNSSGTVKYTDNIITFTNATDQTGSVRYMFSEDELLNLSTKTITITYKLLDGFETNKEVQWVIKAHGNRGGASDNAFRNVTYPTLYDPDDNPSAIGFFNFSGSSLITAANTAETFDLTGFRLENNGGTWTNPDSGKFHNRQFSYSILIESLTIE